MRRLLKWMIDVLFAVYLAGVFGLTVFVWFDRTNVAWVEMLRTAYWLGLWSVIPALGVAVALKCRRTAAVLIVPLTVLILYYLPLFLPKSPAAPPNATQFTIMTYNILRADRGVEEVATIINAVDADIVAIQELSEFVAEQLSVILAESYPHQALHPQTGRGNSFRGQGVFSRFPIIEERYWQFDIPVNMSHGHQRLVLDINGTEVVVFNTHAWPPFGWEGGLHFLNSYYEDQAHRMSIEGIVAYVDAEVAYPVVLAGDLNMSEEFAEYDLLASRLTDSFRVAGQGTGFTYPSRGLGLLPPIMRLDYVWHDESFRTLEAQVWHESGLSDHLPVVVRLALLE